ncbi:MAG: hypothetical protein MUF09_10735 [Candidatus Nanopelagicales bacterium]|nr:hypothetical protein [Candidatus Nanopelagicales bacterium]
MIRTKGTIDGVAVNVGVERADVLETAFLHAGQLLQRRLDDRPGDVASCRLRPADPDEVPLPDVHRALVDAARLVAFQRNSSAERRRLLQPIEQVARAQTGQQRIAALVRSLAPV